MDGGAWWAAIHGVAMSPAGLSDFTFTFHFPALAGGLFLPLSFHLGTPDLLNQNLWGCGPGFCVVPSPSGDSDTR